MARRTAVQRAAATLGRTGASKGGVARAKKLGRRRRSEIASKAAKARWKRCGAVVNGGELCVRPMGHDGRHRTHDVKHPML